MSERIPIGRRTELQCDLSVPPAARGLVVFAHGSRSGRSSPANRAVAEALGEAGFATLLPDLLTERETDRGREPDVEILADRLLAVLDWADADPSLCGLPAGLFGASTGAAAVLLAAAVAGERVRAVVCRGGRPDLAGGALAHVLAPTLLIVGGSDRFVLGLNEDAAELITGPAEFEIVPGAGHLFEESGALSLLSSRTTAWCETHLVGARQRTPGVPAWTTG